MNATNKPTSRKANSDCWCGASSFKEFGPDYLQCTTCGTLVSQKGLPVEKLAVVDDEIDFYGKKYWLDHQSDDLDQPDINVRTRTDLPERNLYWLRTLLKYCLPPARVMELGCAHGSFVALMQQCGFHASGVEMSPWVVDLGRKAFGIDVQLGPVESLEIEPGSVDVIAMMDVMEHLPDPVATMSRCLSLLKADGILLVQMPNFEEGMRFESLVSSSSPFLEMLLANEHLYLYSKRATVEFFHRLGADHIAFEPAIFAHYDMCFVVSRAPLQINDQAKIDASLLATQRGRIGLALLDMKDRYDRLPVLEQEIAALKQQLQELYVRADAVSNERNLVQAQLADLQGHFEAAERDRAARALVIQDQGVRISELEGQVHLKLQELNNVYARMQAESERMQAAELEGKLEVASTTNARTHKELQQHAADAIRLANLLTEKESAFQAEVRRRDAELEAMRQRWWWKLGSFFKAL